MDLNMASSVELQSLTVFINELNLIKLIPIEDQDEEVYAVIKYLEKRIKYLKSKIAQ